MLTNSKFWWGVALGVVGTWAFHAFIRPMPRKEG
jgi:hypothetical protein